MTCETLQPDQERNFTLEGQPFSALVKDLITARMLGQTKVAEAYRQKLQELYQAASMDYEK